MRYWEGEVVVWWAESRDIKGLVGEAATIEELLADLRQTVPDLLAINHGAHDPNEPVELNSWQIALRTSRPSDARD